MRMIIATIISKLKEKTARKNWLKVMALDAAMQGFTPDQVAWNTAHPKHKVMVAEFSKNPDGGIIASDTIAFGDSIIYGSRDQLSSVSVLRNFSIWGSWAHHMAHMANEMSVVLKNKGIHGKIKYVVIGCLGGNPLLMRQPLDVTVAHSRVALDVVRREYPDAKIIVYGLPPTVSFYVTQNAIAFEGEIYRWVFADGNAVFMPLAKGYGALFGLLPRLIMSIDGVHFQAKAKVLFDDQIKKAKDAAPGSIII